MALVNKIIGLDLLKHNPCDNCHEMNATIILKFDQGCQTCKNEIKLCVSCQVDLYQKLIGTWEKGVTN